MDAAPAISQPTPDKINVLHHNMYDSTDDLSPANVAPSPFDQFRKWFKDAVEHDKVREPEVMSLATATPNGLPSVRIVLLKQLDARGFTFYTNYNSRKSQELEANPHAAITFYWPDMFRSVRICGIVEKVTREQSEEYFKSRPVGSRHGAWASKQSSVVADGEVQARLQKIEERFPIQSGSNDADVALPEFWGGWRVVPNEIEFWSGKPSRLHDRVRYTLQDGSWIIDRLAP